MTIKSTLPLPVRAAYDFLNQWKERSLAHAAAHYLRQRPFFGAKDRRSFYHFIYTAMRWSYRIDHLMGKLSSWKQRLHWLYENPNFLSYRLDATIAPHIEHSLCPSLLELLQASAFPMDKLAWINTPAPLFLRQNRLKVPALLPQEWHATRLHHPTNAIQLAHHHNLSQHPLLRSGAYIVQDLGSQLCIAQCPAHSNPRVLDFCAGSGGKTLALAAHLHNKGTYYLHDVRPTLLETARKRCLQAGVHNAHFSAQIEQLEKGTFDIVLADVPCTGSGILRRQPEMKYKIDAAMLEQKQRQQRAILQQAQAFVALNGYLVFITCSILSQENSFHDALFTRDRWQPICPPLQLIADSNGADGFYCALWRRHSA